jgi:hypothetical protein
MDAIWKKGGTWYADGGESQAWVEKTAYGAWAAFAVWQGGKPVELAVKREKWEAEVEAEVWIKS